MRGNPPPMDSALKGSVIRVLWFFYDVTRNKLLMTSKSWRVCNWVIICQTRCLACIGLSCRKTTWLILWSCNLARSYSVRVDNHLFTIISNIFNERKIAERMVSLFVRLAIGVKGLHLIFWSLIIKNVFPISVGLMDFREAFRML